MNKTFRTLALALAIIMMAVVPLSLAAAIPFDEDLDAALNVEGGALTFTNGVDYPMSVTTVDGRTCAVTTNQSVNSSTSSVTLNIDEVTAGNVLSFDVRISSEARYDKFQLRINGEVNSAYTLSGVVDWTTLNYVIPADGAYTFVFEYSKDGSVNGGEDTMWLDNVSIAPPVAVTGVNVTPEAATVYVGVPLALAAEILPANATNRAVTWTSDNEAIATVSADGVVTALAEGECDITATTVDGGFSASCHVTVPAPIMPESISLNFTGGSLVSGEYMTAVATVLPENAYDRSVVWSSSDTSILTVNAAGRITAVSGAEGTATITATTVNGVTATIELTTILPANLPSVDTFMVPIEGEVNVEYTGTLGWGYSPVIRFPRSSGTTTYLSTTHGMIYSFELEAGKTYDFLTYSPTNTNLDTCINVYGPGYTFIAYDDSGAGSGFGQFVDYTVQESGTYYLLITGYNYRTSGDYAIRVFEQQPIPVESVEFAEESVIVPIGGTVRLGYSILPENADILDVTWSSADETIATVADGIVTGVATGSTTITVTTVDGGYTDTIDVIVNRETIIFSENFDPTVTGWTRIDDDNDGIGWYFGEGSRAHGGVGGYAASDSFTGDEPLSPDNWLTSSEIAIPNDGNIYTLKYYVSCDGYDGEHYGVYIATEENPEPQLIHEETLSNITYELRQIDLTPYAGQTITLSWRHFDCYDAMSLLLDTITVSGIAPEETTPELGDVNGDGEINILDAVMVMRSAMQMITLTDAQLELADFDADGNVNIFDALLILRHSLA